MTSTAPRFAVRSAPARARTRVAALIAVLLAHAPPPGLARAPDAAAPGSPPSSWAAAPRADLPAVADPEACTQPLPEALDWVAALRRMSICNREVRVALRIADAVRADIRTAGQRPNPTLSGGMGSVSFSYGLGAGGILDKQVDYVTRLDQTIERGDKRRLRIDAAGAAWQAAVWGASDVLRARQLDLAQAWIELWGAQERVQLQQAIGELYDRTLDGARRRLKAGDVAAADVTRIELDLQRATAELAIARGDLVRARHLLAAPLASVPPVQRIVEPWPATGVEPSAPTEPGHLERPDLLAARARLAAADAQGRLARSLQTRDISVGVQLDRYAAPSGNGWMGGVYLAVPLFWHHRHEGEVARAEADSVAAAAEVARLEAAALGEQRRLEQDWHTARERRERLERDALPLARKVAANAELAYAKGAGTVLELLDALRQLRGLQLDALAARLEQDRADAAARAAMLTAAAAADPVFGQALRLRPDNR